VSPPLTLLLGLALAAPEPAMSTAISTADVVQRTMVSQARLDLLRNETRLPPGPFAEVQDRLLRTPGAHLGYAISPRGRALGLVATGSGEALADTVSAILTELTDARTAKMFRTLANLQGHNGLHLEIVLGAPSHVRAGVRDIDDLRARVVLDEEGFPVSERGRLLGQGKVVGLDVVSDGVHASTLVVVSEEEVDGPGLTGAHRVHVSRYAGQPHLLTVRRTGLEDRALIDWIVAVGASGDGAARRLGGVHGTMEARGPDEIGWTQGALADSIVFYYRAPPMPPQR
jgi:hypothetical protein